jgi:hypothetical protein
MEGKNDMNRKESIGRLLLTLLTVFIMVIGVLGAAVTNFDEARQPEVPLAVSELDEEVSEIGDAPISAHTSGFDNTNDRQETSLIDMVQSSTEIGTIPMAVSNPDTDPDTQAIESIEGTTVSYAVDETRATGVDANGPYGTITAPFYEGNPVNFHADAIPSSENGLHMFRWEVTGDDEFDGPGAAPDYWGAMGENEMPWMYMDNNIGEVMVQAWDGMSYTYVYGDGIVMNDESYDGYWYYYYVEYSTFGYEFTVTETVTIDELAAYRSYYPYQTYWIYVYDTSGGYQGGVTGLPSYPPTYTWNWYSCSPFTLTPGDYVICAYARTYWYYGYRPWMYNPGPTSDGVIVPNDVVRYRSGSGFPTGTINAENLPMLDMHYTYSYAVPLVFEDTADVFVDNIAPVVINPQANPTEGDEGAEVEFTASFMDPGLEDDWWYKWVFGDGTETDWIPVVKFSGGAKVLLFHSIDGYQDEVLGTLAGLLGEYAVVFDEYNFYIDGEPSLEELLYYDVVIVPINTGDFAGFDDLGDLLADYVDAGGGVVEMVAGFYNGVPWQIQGRWMSDEYSCFDPGYVGGSSTTSAIYDPSHPIIDGVAGTVGSWGTSIPISTYGIRPDATLLADYPYYRAAAYKDEGTMGPGSGRIAGLNIFIPTGYRSGDAMMVTANAAWWASQCEPPEVLSMPIALEPISHVYKDDHPDLTFEGSDQDLFPVEVLVKDDDHGRVFFGNEQIVINECYLGAPDWCEIWNHGSADINLNGWQVYFWDNRGSSYSPTYTFGDFILPGGGSVQIIEYYGTDTDTVVYTGWNIWWVGYVPYGGACVLIPTAASGYEIDFVRWYSSFTYPGAYWYPPELPSHGNDIFRIQDLDTDSGSDWDTDNSGGTPNDLNPGQTGQLPPSPDSYVMDGLGTADMEVLIHNVFPTVIAPEGWTGLMEEGGSITFEGFTITDPALKEETETFWWRWLDSYGVYTGWEETHQIIPGAVGGNLICIGVPMDFPLYYGYSPDGAMQLMYNILNFCIGDEGTVLLEDTSWWSIPGDDAVIEANMNAEFGCNHDWIYDATGTDLVDAGGNTLYDFLYFSYDWAYEGSAYDVDQIQEYLDAGGHVLVTGDEFGPHDPIDFLPWYVAYSAFYPAATFPGPAFVGAVEDAISLDVATGEWGFSYELHNTIDDFDAAEFLPVFADPDPYTVIIRPGEARHPKNLILPRTFWIGDNGQYPVDIQVIDDDMRWDVTGGYPIFVGPGEETDWVSHNVFNVIVNNVDPTLTPLNAVVNMDLVIRTTGEPNNDCTMTLWDADGPIDSVTVHHDGNYKMETMPATLNMGMINDYYVTVEYVNADPDGANPTWVFEGRFASGHIKELKNIFKEDGTLWVIDASFLKDMIVGEDIIFTAAGSDTGSDDLAFDWQFGDGSEGIHVYANTDLSMEDGICGPPENIFDGHPDREPWFDVLPNTIRSAEINPIRTGDEISHAYQESGYYYVCLILMDDDVCDGYSSYQNFLNGGGYDMEFIEIDLS